MGSRFWPLHVEHASSRTLLEMQPLGSYHAVSLRARGARRPLTQALAPCPAAARCGPSAPARASPPASSPARTPSWAQTT